MNTTEIRSTVDEILAKAQVSFSVTYSGATKRDKWECDAWNVRLAAKGATMQTQFFTGLGLRKAPKFRPMLKQGYDYPAKPAAPCAADVLHSLVLDAGAQDQSFADWCGDLGYSDDSIDAFEMYRKCCKTASELRTVFRPETLAALRDAVQEL